MTDTLPGTHFTAHVKITLTSEAVVETDRYNNVTKQTPRGVTDIAEIAVRAKTYEKLIERVNAIVANAHE